jgi:hypothetical protein
MITVQFVHGPLNGNKQALPENIYSNGDLIYCMVLPSERHFSPLVYTTTDLTNMFEQHLYRLMQTPEGWVAVYSNRADIQKD